ncbi:MAG: hypothetical protein KDB27_16040 [Planctomycetales bacterium]|nr:hypothetical protein [Planctomycetales bacterium]
MVDKSEFRNTFRIETSDFMGAEGLQVIYRRLSESGVDYSDTYRSEWIGAKPTSGRGPRGRRLILEGEYAVGIYSSVKFNRPTTEIGLLVMGDEPNVDVVSPTLAIGPFYFDRGRIDTSLIERFGRGRSESQSILAPEGGIMAGIKISVGEGTFGEAIRGVQPLFQVGQKYEWGVSVGTVTYDSFTAVAKPGYAVGGLRIARATSIDACQVNFMRIDGHMLNPQDCYQSQVVGDSSRVNRWEELNTEGMPAVGIQAHNDRSISALGLVLAECHVTPPIKRSAGSTSNFNGDVEPAASSVDPLVLATEEPATAKNVHSPNPFRLWTSASGTTKVEARLVSVSDEGTATLVRKKDGKKARVPLSKLSKADQDFIKSTRDTAAETGDR